MRTSASRRRCAAVRAMIDSGAIGTPSWARIRFRTGFDVYRTQPYFYDEERLAIADVGIHMLDLARFFLGEVERISCETQRRNPKVRAEDTATMLLRHESGARQRRRMHLRSAAQLPTRSRKRCWRSRADAARSSSMPAAG